MKRVANQRKREQRDRTERQDGGDGVGGVLIVGVNGALRRDDRSDPADRRADREKVSERPELT